MTKTIRELPEIKENFDALFASGGVARALADFATQVSPIFRRSVSQGQQTEDYVFMVGPEANRFVMHTGRHHFSHAIGWQPLVGDMFGKGLLNMDPPEHTRHRQMWNPAFTTAYMETYIPVIHKIIQNRTGRWTEAEAVDVYAEARDITFDAAAAALAGFELGDQMDELRQMFYKLLHGFDAEDDEATYWQKALVIQQRLVGLLLQLLAERRQMPADQEAGDVLTLMVRARDEEGNAYTDEQLLAHLNILLVAGHETTTTLSAWALYKLATEPAWCARLREEVDQVLQDLIPLGDTNTMLPIESLRQLPEMDSFIKEVGRLYPPVINVPRGTLSEFEFAGYTIPAGSTVRLSLGASHLLPEVFENPQKFDPDRFGPERREDRRSPYSLVTFGGGPRICIGINFAQIEVKALLAHVLRHYEISAAPDLNPKYMGYFTSMIPDGLPLSFTKRTGMKQ